MGPRMTWTVEQRTVVHLLRTQTSHTLERQCAIFNHLYAAELRAGGYTSGLTLYRYRDEYNAKDKEGRSNVWKAVCAKKISAGEQARRDVLMNNINRAAGELGDEVLLPEAAPRKKRKITHTDDWTMDEQANPVPSDEEQSAVEEDDTASIIPESEQTSPILHPPPAPANSLITPLATVPPLEMIHTIRSTTTWNGTVPHSPSSAFLRHTDSVYQAGGHVVRAIIDGHTQDVMLCDAAHCAPCKHGENTKFVFAASRENKGLPFAHVSELHSPGGVGFYFVGAMDLRGQEFPRKQWKSTARFWDGLSRPVRLCVVADCETCSGKEAVAKKAARYQPGGDLYDSKVLQQEERYGGAGAAGVAGPAAGSE